MLRGCNILHGVHAGADALQDEYRIIAPPAHPQAQKLLVFWNARPSDGIIIGRDVPSRSIANILSNVTIDEPVNGGLDCRVRLAGESIKRRFGRGITGMLMSELFPPNDFRGHLDDAFANIEAGMATVIDSRLSNWPVEKMHLEVVILPVLAPDRVSK